MEKVVRKLSFQEAEEEEEKYWMNKTPQEKIAVLTQLHSVFNGGKRLEKVIGMENLIRNKIASGRAQDIARSRKTSKA